MRIPLLFIMIALLCPAWARAAIPERFGERDATLHVSAQEILRWSENGATVLHLKRDVRIYQGATALTAPEAVAWFQETAVDTVAPGTLVVYVASGKISTDGTARLLKAPGLFQSAPARGLVLNGTVAAAGDAPSGVAFVATAVAFRRGETPTGPAGKTEAVLELLRPAAEDISVTELQNGNAVITLRGNAQISGDHMSVKADTIRARVISAEVRPGKTEYRLRSVYAEGAVEMQRDSEQVVAQSLYMDLPNQTGLALDARVRGHAAGTGLPAQFHADAVRQMNRYRFMLEGGGYFSTSVFADPHYRVQGKEIEVVSGSREPGAEEDQGQQSMVATSHHNVFYVGPVPVMYWPYLAKDLRNGAFFLSSVELGVSGGLGTYVRLSWDLYDLVYYSSKKSSLSLLTDYYVGRGPGVGLDFRYHTAERRGWARAYYVHDRGEFDEPTVRTPQVDRGEFTIQDREFLAEHWRMDVEVGYLSDWRFLNTYDQKDLDTTKDRETEVFLRYLSDNQMATWMVRERINDFQNAVDRESAGWHIFADQVGDSPLLWTMHTDLSRLRLRQDERTDPPDYPALGRLDTAHELSLPFMAGPIRLAPYLWEDATAYTRTADDNASTLRLASAAGFRAGTSFYRTFDSRSEWLGVDGLRHIMTPVVDLQDIYAVNKSSSQFIQNDEIDALDKVTQVTVTLRNRLQTHRFVNGERTLVNFLVADLGYTDLLHGQPINSPPDSHADLSLTWQATENIKVSSEDNRYNTEQRRLEAGNAELNLDFWKPITFNLLYKYYLETETAGAPAHSVLSPGLTYQPLYSRWKVEIQTNYDFKGGSGRKGNKLGTGVFLTRYLEDWAVRFGVELNNGVGNETVFSFSVQTPGSRRGDHPYTITGPFYY